MIRLPRALAVLTRLGLTVLAGGSILATTGCATPAGTAVHPFRAVVFSIPYDAIPNVGDCPGLPTSDSPCSGDTECALLQGGNATVEFKAVGPNAATRKFTVRFDPFEKTGFESGNNGSTGAIHVPKAHSGKNVSPKEFTFFIVDKNKKCVPVDPRIIVER
jgi:hypothetical protein